MGSCFIYVRKILEIYPIFSKIIQKVMEYPGYILLPLTGDAICFG